MASRSRQLLLLARQCSRRLLISWSSSTGSSKGSRAGRPTHLGSQPLPLVSWPVCMLPAQAAEPAWPPRRSSSGSSQPLCQVSRRRSSRQSSTYSTPLSSRRLPHQARYPRTHEPWQPVQAPRHRKQQQQQPQPALMRQKRSRPPCQPPLHPPPANRYIPASSCPTSG